MKILIMLTRRHNEILRIEETLLYMGHEVEKIYVDHFQSCHNYFWKKIDELGFSKPREKYEGNILEEACKKISAGDVDKMLCINFVFKSKDRGNVKELLQKNKCSSFLWMVDPVDRNSKSENIYKFFDKSYFYEYDDAKYIAENYHVTALYEPVGYNLAYKSAIGGKPVKDIVFVGMPYKKRMNILDRLSVVAEAKGWSLDVYGPFYGEQRYFWQKYKRKYKYPALFRHVCNGEFSSEEIAKIYSQYKICINIHSDSATGMNPRSYEIMATGSFLLMDERQYYDIFIPDKDFAVYSDFEDMVMKIEKYLCDDELRSRIADTGNAHITKYSMENILERMLDM